MIFAAETPKVAAELPRTRAASTSLASTVISGCGQCSGMQWDPAGCMGLRFLVRNSAVSGTESFLLLEEAPSCLDESFGE